MIRQFSMEDYSEVYELWRNTPGIGLRSIDDSKEGIECFLKRNPTTCFVAEEDGQIVGVILGGHDGRRGAIYHACVSEAYRRRSIARQLMDQVVEAMKNEKITRLGLLCLAHNETGNHYWTSLGWEQREDIHYYSVSINEDNV